MKQSAKLIARLYFGGIFILIIGGILWLNQIDYAILTLTIGGSMLAIYYLIQFVNPPFKAEYDWSLVYPELSGLGKIDDKK